MMVDRSRSADVRQVRGDPELARERHLPTQPHGVSSTLFHLPSDLRTDFSGSPATTRRRISSLVRSVSSRPTRPGAPTKSPTTPSRVSPTSCSPSSPAVGQRLTCFFFAVFGGRGITAGGMGRYIETFQRTYKFDALLGGAEEILFDLGVRQAMRKMPRVSPTLGSSFSGAFDSSSLTYRRFSRVFIPRLSAWIPLRSSVVLSARVNLSSTTCTRNLISALMYQHRFRTCSAYVDAKHAHCLAQPYPILMSTFLPWYPTTMHCATFVQAPVFSLRLRKKNPTNLLLRTVGGTGTRCSGADSRSCATAVRPRCTCRCRGSR